jgi:hypothetical protein
VEVRSLLCPDGLTLTHEMRRRVVLEPQLRLCSSVVCSVVVLIGCIPHCAVERLELLTDESWEGDRQGIAGGTSLIP